MTNYYKMAEETYKEKIVMYSISAIIGVIAGPFIVLYFLIKWLVDIYRIGWKLAWAKYYNEKLYKRYESIKQARWKRIDKEQNGWPIDPVERAKCPRLEDLKVDEFECYGYIEDTIESLIYVANESCPELEEIFTNHIDELNQWAAPANLHFIYIPSLLPKLRDEEVLRYMMPWTTDIHAVDMQIGNDYMFQFLIHPEDRKKMKHGIYYCNTKVRFDHYVQTYICSYFELSPPSEMDWEEQLLTLKKWLNTKVTWLQLGVYSTAKDSAGDEPIYNADNQFNSQEYVENIDDLIAEVRERVERLRVLGVADHILESLFFQRKSPSKLVITRDYRIFLPDYNNLEIKMQPLVKAVYLLFLNNPEGLMFKDLPDYREELTKIYLLMKPNGLTERVKKSIEDVTDPTKNSINEKCARIRGAFLEQFDNHLAKHYYINGLRAEPKKIALPRELVVWET